MRINQDFIMVVMAGGKMTRYGMHVHQMLKTDESNDENENKGD